MGIRPNFSSKDLDKYHKKIEKQVFEKAIRGYLYLGEAFVTHAKNNVEFMDQTGNLRSSIGYVLFVNGQVYKEAYTLHKKGNEGIKEGPETAKRIASTLRNNKIVLVLTAGMNYALYVESKGYNVLTATEHEAKLHALNMFRNFMRDPKM
ncbi:hypothetical protein IF125_08720 [Empedobacter stercoris]|uniref:hypothetical protein n=1 Tax=Empedobacter stercoris TaxID=1628248 RepID=UPI001CE0D741|nr:hypothetical protein [Empedobacter stercoris]MCA4782347.1 hypothetical protein [Empedobacter stercoris]